MLAGNTTGYNCQSCNEHDALDSMVACDVCSAWHHFKCAGVDHTIKDRKWMCNKCVGGESSGLLNAPQTKDKTGKGGASRTSKSRSKKGEKTIGSKVSATSSARAAALEAQMLLLEEEERLKENELKEQEELQRQELAEQQRKLEMKRNLMEEEARLREVGLSKQKDLQEKMMTLRRESMEKKKELLRQQAELSECSSSSRISKFERIKNWISSQQKTEGDDLADHAARISTSNSVTVNPATPLHQSRRVSSPSIPQLANLSLHDDDHSITNPALPTAYMQIAARQVTGKDLPVFSGNPEDWPMFIRTYEETTIACGFSDVENLVRLQKCLRGNALETVRSRLMMPAGVPHVIKTLQMRFGRPELIIRSLLERVRRVPAPKSERLDTLIDFGLAVENLVVHLQAAKQENHLTNPVLLQELISKLPAQLRLDWARYKLLHQDNTLVAFGEFMNELIQAASEVSFDLPVSSPARAEKPRDREKAFVYAHDAVETESRNNGVMRKIPKPCIVCGATGHRLAECEEFEAKGIQERMQIVRQHNLCRTCLNFHQKWPCRTWQGCGMEGCREKHHFLLHPPTPTSSTHLSSSHTAVISQNCDRYPYFRILPVVVSFAGKQETIFAFVDEGSSSTLLDHSIAEQLGLDGPKEPLTLQWTGNVARQESKSKRVRFQIAGAGKGAVFQIEGAHTVERLLLPKQSLSYGALAERYPHLRGLPIADYEQAEPKVLIGLDNLRLCIPLKIREGYHHEPIAAKCRLGWTIYGYSACAPMPTVSINFHAPAASDVDYELNEQLNDYFSLDQLGTKPVGEVPESEEDKRSRMILEKTTRRVSGRFETGLLWKSDDIVFPDSFPMAVQRLKSLERKLSREPSLRARVHEKIEEYVAKGYCHRASLTELDSVDCTRVWYLPLCVVVNPKKPHKVRVVWDAAAKVNGVSFNSALLKGPDLLTSIVCVLYHFREHRVAVTGDIEEMFLRILIRPQDSQSQRFLWRGNAEAAPSVYIIDVATFGSTCSPSSAQFVKNTNAMEHMESFPRASTAIIRYHYVDDYLDSFETEEEAIEVVQQVKSIHSTGGFNLRNFLSNSDALLTAIDGISDEDAKQLSVSRAEKVESVLGMKWNPSKDVFIYTLTFREELDKVIQPSHVPTKREMLKLVMSLFDPLGFMTFYLIHGRALIQDVWATGVDWDVPINNDLCQRWRQWISYLPRLSDVTIPRCYFRSQMDGRKQLHMFVDASDAAYACVAYLRAHGTRGVEVALVGAKSKVAPLKVLSVPRLELMAAVIGARMADSVAASHSYDIAETYFWTDSSTVLAWINSDHRKYHKFVGVRIGEILALTKMNQWRWVPTKQNPADDATKWGNGPCFDPRNRWFCGPSFLFQPEAEWPTNTKAVSTNNELNCTHNIHHVTPIALHEFSRFSKWERLLRTQAYVFRFINNVRCRKNGQCTETGFLNQEELKRAEKELWKQAQAEAYSQERRILMETQGSPDIRHRLVPKLSPLYKLWPYIDRDGVIRMRGRIGAAWYASSDAKYPIILPKSHQVTLLLVDYYHRRYHHANHETVVNEMRQRFEISHLRTVVKQTARRCVRCHIQTAVPRPPPMASLPEQRLTPMVRPFTFVGLDYFGPLTVKVGRTQVKRWIALFTCLTVRAIHLEVVHSLSSESCVLAIRRFIARRGAPAEFFSDNGTSFVGASKQLQQEIAMRNEILASTFTNTNTRWNFNSPGAPHMGGVWERLVRSVKNAIGMIIDTPHRPTDELLETILFDAEAMINSRPLTYIPLETADEESLTPNHFLLGSSSGVKQPPSELGSRINLRSCWNQAQHSTDTIWKRWIKEYLPVITRRCKWFDEVRDIQEGDLVLIVETSMRNRYVRGRVEKVFPGRDGRVRQALVRTATGAYKRPAAKLALLDVGSRGKPGIDSSD